MGAGCLAPEDLELVLPEQEQEQETDQDRERALEMGVQGQDLEMVEG